MTLIEQTINAITPLDEPAMASARVRQGRLTKPPGSLGRLEELSIWLAGAQGQARPRIERPVVVVAAGDHGVAAAGVSAYPAEVTPQMVANFLAGGAAISVLARQAGARVVVVDAGIAVAPAPHPARVSRRAGDGTADISRGPAMSVEQARAVIEDGIRLASDLVRDGADLLAAGEMGIGNTTPSAAIVSASTGLPPSIVTGLGTGITPERHAHKVAVVQRALEVNRPDAADGLDLLAKVGGFEIGFLAGLMLGGAAARMPVVLDGFITAAAALVARALCPAATAYMVAAHRSVEPGHIAALEMLRLKPLFDLRLRLGEASGAALAIPLLRAAAAVLDEMATFEEAGVSGSDEARDYEV
jgi:nicotinate-nucleotide--dimethylbenzimidazole phosphoribosyltransferase